MSNPMAHVVVEERPDAVVVRLARPPVNALDLALVGELEAAIRAAAGARALVLTGSGTCFSAGIDVKAVPGYAPEQQRAMVRAVNRVVLGLFTLPIPTVAAVNGHALGGGLCLALTCDHRVATSEPACRLALPEVELDIPYPAAPLRVLRERLEPRTRDRLVMTGARCGPEEGHRLGLVDEIAAPDALLQHAIDAATRLAALRGWARVKAQLHAAAVRDLEDIVANDRDPMLDGWLGS